MTAHERPWRAGTVLVILAAPLLALAAIWLPELGHHRVATPALGADMAAGLRTAPTDAVLAHLDGLRYGLDAAAPVDSVARAEEILRGRFRTLSGAVLPLRLEPDDAGLVQGRPADQLEIAAMTPADTLLAAYRLTRDERYLEAALRSALAWSRYERAAWLPHGYLWNDHAVAARVLVLASLWRQYRQHPQYRPEVAAEILTFAARSTALLARADHYTARTNHGIMQDLALLHAAVAFPALPGTAEHTRVALDRLAMHLAYYVTPGGVVLEHSITYQDFAIHLLGTALVYVDLLKVPEPAGLRARHAAAECWQRRLTRPDGSVPLYGDTWSARRSAAVVAASAAVACPSGAGPGLDPDFGYAIVDDFGDAGQRLFMTWANFAGRAHKHDDELAVWLWADGRDWWDASGYWPYGDPARAAATSWRGSNAPHGAGEGPGDGGASVLRGYALAGEVRVLDVERASANGERYRRQVAGLPGAGVIVIDSVAGGGGPLESVWTLPPAVSLREAGSGRYVVAAADTGVGEVYGVAFLGGTGLALARLRGSSAPFGGLVSVNSAISEADAVAVSAPRGGWTLAAWRGDRDGAARPLVVRMTRWAGPESWALAVETPAGVGELARAGGTLSATAPGVPAQTIVLDTPSPERPLLERAQAAYREAARRYPPFRDLREYRVRASLATGGLFLLQFPALWLAGRRGLHRRWPLAVVTLGWVGVAAWLYYAYLV